MSKPHIVLIVPRGEAVRNFLFSDTLSSLHQQAQVTLLSVVTAPHITHYYDQHVDRSVVLKEYTEKRLVRVYRDVVHDSHFRWLDSGVARNSRAIKNAGVKTPRSKLKRTALNQLSYVLGHRPILEQLTRLERELTWRLRPTDDFVELFKELKPDLVFNCSHIHGQAGSLPTRTAHRLGIPTAGFIFSWDNLTSRSRIFEPYDHYLVWHKGMRDQLLSLYPNVRAEQVHITGTPQFDYHFKPAYWLSREELAERIGIDPARPYILYTTGADKHFPEEHHHIKFVADYLAREFPEVQLVVRMYIKGIGEGTKALATENRPNVIFPPVRWDAKWITPEYDDLATYTSLLKHAAMGINPASTVSLELMMFDKPVMNIGFDPPTTQLASYDQWERHIHFDHYKPVADSGGVMVAYSQAEMCQMIADGLTRPEQGADQRRAFIDAFFGPTVDGLAGQRVAQTLLAQI